MSGVPEQTYRCPECSTRSTVVVVPADERQEHEAWHAAEVAQVRAMLGETP